ncbi:Y-family DNA polymerase [Aurantivibrio plasticivorans]
MKKSQQRDQLWLCLHLPQLPLDQLSRQLGARKAQGPLAIVEKQRLVFVNTAAQAKGLRVDMRLATAYALEPDLHVVERNDEHEQQALEKLTEWAYQFTPTVNNKAFSLLLEISGCLRLFRGVSRLRGQIQRGLQSKGFHCVEGLAHTQEAAWLFARFRTDNPEQVLSDSPLNEFVAPPATHWKTMLEQMPVAYLDGAEKQQQQLINAGLTTLQDLFLLPSTELGSRYGKLLIEQLASLAGNLYDKQYTARPVQDFIPSLVFLSYREFQGEITNSQGLELPITELLSELCQFLVQHGVAASQLSWTFYYFKHPSDQLNVDISSKQQNLAGLQHLTRLKLESFSLSAPLESLALKVEQFTTLDGASQSLFPELSLPNEQLNDFKALLDKLMNRLGDNALMILDERDEHLPELQQACLAVTPLTIDRITLPKIPNIESTSEILPLWLSQQAIPISAPHLPTDKHNAPNTTSPLRVVYGPKRIDSHWWQHRQQRDYFIARHNNGSYCWVYQNLLNQRWYLHGFYG